MDAVRSDQSGPRQASAGCSRRFRWVKPPPEAIPLNLVSMIDVFTTLVFFLMPTSANAQTLSVPKSLELPPLMVVQPPEDSAVVPSPAIRSCFRAAR